MIGLRAAIVVLPFLSPATPECASYLAGRGTADGRVVRTVVRQIGR
jgi:hypothetical protein